MIFVWLIVFLLGLAVGSFLNVVVYRLIQGESPLKGRSKCPHCKRQVWWRDNIPLVSFMVLRGKCRFCKKPISWRYPALELLTGVLFVWWYGVGQFFFRLTSQPYKTVQPVYWLLVGLTLAGLLVSDLFYGVLPDVFTVGLSVVSFLYRFGLTVAGIMQLRDFLLLVASGVVAGLFFGFLLLVTGGRGMGMGDVKLALALGWLLGWPKSLIALLLAFLTGAIAGIILIVVGKKRLGQTIPFGPFMILGTGTALIWGEAIWSSYLRILGL